MGNVTLRKRLERLTVKAAMQNTPPRDSLADISVFAELAAQGIVSAETLAKIQALRGDASFDPYECCTTEELKRMLALCER